MARRVAKLPPRKLLSSKTNSRVAARRNTQDPEQSPAALAQLAEQRFCNFPHPIDQDEPKKQANIAVDGAAGPSPSPRTVVSLAGLHARRVPGFDWLSRVLR